jgi:hypothetical protein
VSARLGSSLLDRLSLPATVAGGTALAALCFYPGYLSGDANWQYEQAIAGIYTDWHPVLMTWLWRQLDRAIEGPGGMFLFQVAVLWAGIALSVREACRGLASYTLPVLAIGLWPPVFALQSQIGKDAGMVGALLLCFGLLARSKRTKSRAALAGSALAAWYALSVRHNGASAILPLALWAGVILAERASSATWRARLATPVRRVALGLGLFAALYGAGRLSSEWILGPDGGRYKLHQLIPIYDLVGISLRSGINYVPESHGQGTPWTMRELWEIYNPHSNLWLHWKDPGAGPRVMPLFERDETVQELFASWAQAIRAQPAAYATHRWELFLGHLGIAEGTPKHTVRFGVSPAFHYVGPTRFDSALGRAVSGYLADESDSLLFEPWLYLSVTGLCLVFAWRTRSRHLAPVAALGASSRCLTAPFARIGVASDFRYLWWVVLAALVQLVFVLDGLGEEPASGETREPEEAP